MIRDRVIYQIAGKVAAGLQTTISDKEIAEQILAIKELAVVNRDAKLPSIFNVNDNVIPTLAYKEKLQGYVQEEK